jgi:hypothetical protein
MQQPGREVGKVCRVLGSAISDEVSEEMRTCSGHKTDKTGCWSSKISIGLLWLVSRGSSGGEFELSSLD